MEKTAVQRGNCACRAIKSTAIAVLIIGLGLPFIARADYRAATCDAPFNMLRLAHPLLRVAHKLTANEPITIIAIGSSSTAGAGATSPAATYPSRLAVELEQHFPNHKIRVINRGVNGEEVDDMLKRFDSAIIAAKPDLVLWQLGTNSIIRDQLLSDRDTSMRDGLKKIHAIGADVILIDPQFAPKVIAKPGAESVVELIAATAKKQDVDLFRRFDVMKRWVNVDHMSFDKFVSVDGLHMNDWGYACMAKGLGMAIAEAVERPAVTAIRAP